MKLVKRYITFFVVLSLGLSVSAQDTVSTSSGRILVNKDGTWQKLDSNKPQEVKTPPKTKRQKQTYLKTITLMRTGPDRALEPGLRIVVTKNDSLQVVGRLVSMDTSYLVIDVGAEHNMYPIEIIKNIESADKNTLVYFDSVAHVYRYQTIQKYKLEKITTVTTTSGVVSCQIIEWDSESMLIQRRREHDELIRIPQSDILRVQMSKHSGLTPIIAGGIVLTGVSVMYGGFAVVLRIIDEIFGDGGTPVPLFPTLIGGTAGIALIVSGASSELRTVDMTQWTVVGP